MAAERRGQSGKGAPAAQAPQALKGSENIGLLRPGKAGKPTVRMEPKLKKALTGLYTGLNKTKAVVTLVVAALYLVLVSFSGGSVLQVGLFALVLAGYIVLPGVLFARIAARWRQPKGFFGPLALLYGVGFFAALYCVAMRLGLLWLLHGLPVALSLVCLWVCVRPALKALPQKLAMPQPHQWMLILLFSALLLFFSFYFVAKNGHPAAVGNVLLDQDLLWNVGNANSFKLAFPPQDIRFEGVRLHYHYLTELLAGALSIVSGIPAFNILAYYLQPFMLAALVLCLYRFGRLLFSGSRFQALLLTYAPFLFSCASLWKILPNGLSVFWNANITHLVTNVNSQATATMMLCIFLGLFVAAARRRYKTGFVWAASLVAAFFLLCFAKGPMAALVAIGLVLALVIGLFQKRTGWRGLLLGAAVGGIFLVVYTLIFSGGANDSMTLSISQTIAKGYFNNIQDRIWHENLYAWYVAIFVLWVVQAFLMAPAQFPLFVRGGVADLRRFGRLSPYKLLFNAVALGGIAAYFLFDHPSMSQAYFLYTALFFMNILAVYGVGRVRALWRGAAFGAKRKARPKGALAKRLALAFLAVCCAVGVATTGFLYVHMVGSGARQVLRNLGVTQKYPYELVMTPDEEQAMLWLRDNSPQTAMFATNRIHTGARREGISNFYSAFCERQGYMEGYQYAKTNMGVSAAVIEEKMRVNTALFSAETPPEDIIPLCRQYGIDYLIFCTQMNGVDASDSQLAAAPLLLVWESANLRIYEVPQQ